MIVHAWLAHILFFFHFLSLMLESYSFAMKSYDVSFILVRKKMLLSLQFTAWILFILGIQLFII